MGGVSAREIAHSEHEAGLDELPQTDSEWQRIANLFQKRAGKQSEFKVRRILKVRWCPTFAGYKYQAAKLGKPTELFHGTKHSNAVRIAKQGFKLPKHSGLYGPGLYFADNPKKSANYAPEASWLPFMERWATNGFWNAVSTKSEGQMLLCDVYLGSSKRCHGARLDLDPTKDLRGCWFRKLLGLGDYDSVKAPGCFIDYTEYIVYREYQAIPKYLIEYGV